jgi:hypothetical protein
MNRRQFLLPAVAATLLPGALRAEIGADALANLRQRLVVAPVHAGEFEQRKSLAGFRNPLVSRGTYTIARDRGVVWDTREPFASVVVITPTSLRAELPGGGTAKLREFRKDAFLGIANQLLFALLTGDVALLQRHFLVEGSARAAGAWQLDLKPRDATLGRWLAEARIEGDQHIAKVQWREVSGDSGTIAFSKQRTAQQLSADETRRFD